MKLTVCESEQNSCFRRQLYTALIASLSMFLVGQLSEGWTVTTLEVLLSSQTPVSLTASEISWLTASPSLGAVISSIPSALLMDRHGRRNSLLLLTSLPFSGALLTYFASSFPALFAARLMAGSWTGVAATVTPVYIAECVEPSNRPFLNSVLNLFLFTGTLAVFIVGMYVSYWTSALLGIVSCTFIWCSFFIIPESPYYYCMRNMEAKAIESLSWLRGDKDVEEEYESINDFVNAESKKGKYFKNFRYLDHLKAFFTVAVATVLVRCSGSATLNIITIIIPKRAFFFLDNHQAAVTLLVLRILFSVSIKLAFFSGFGIRPLLVVSSVGCGASMAVLAAWEYMTTTSSSFVESHLHFVPFLCFVAHSAFSNLGMNWIGWALKGEMLPSKIKSISSALTTIFGNFAVFTVLKLFMPISDQFGSHYNFIISSVFSFALVFFTYFFISETRGKSLEEIQTDLNKSSTKLLTEKNTLFIDSCFTNEDEL